MTNSVILVGKIQTTPMYKYLITRQYCCQFGLKVNRQNSTVCGSKYDVIPVMVFDDEARIIERDCSRKDLLMITGSIQIQPLHKGGQTYWAPKVVGDSIVIIG